MGVDLRVDLNSDVGESSGASRLVDDEALFDSVTSVNVACGYHAGDPLTIAAIVQLAKRKGVAVGAHPSYPDRAGFGRTSMQIAPLEIEALMLYQIGAVDAIARAHDSAIAHVKPHGALYNDAARDRRLADAIVWAVRRYGGLKFVGLAGSSLVDAARAASLDVLSEAFCDRVYESDGTLRSRALDGAMLDDPAFAAKQAVDIVVRGRVRAFDGREIAVSADTLCVHGDTPGAATIARAVRAALEAAGVRVTAPA